MQLRYYAHAVIDIYMYHTNTCYRLLHCPVFADLGDMIDVCDEKGK